MSDLLAGLNAQYNNPDDNSGEEENPHLTDLNKVITPESYGDHTEPEQTESAEEEGEPDEGDPEATLGEEVDEIDEAEPDSVEPPPAAESDVIAGLREQISGILDAVSDLTTIIQQRPSQVHQASGTPTPGSPDPAPIEFVTDDSYANMFSSKDSLNKMLNDVYARGQQSTMQQVVPIINNTVGTQLNGFQKAQNFFSANPDLKQLSTQIVNEVQLIASKNPNKSQDDLLKEAGESIRRKYNLVKKKGLDKPVPKRPTKGKVPAATPDNPASRKAPPKGSSRLQQDINELFDYQNM